MALAGLYRRPLPSPPAIDFASAEGKKLFSESLKDGYMEGFFKLISHFQTQSEPAFCGLASLSMVLNALAVDPGRTWKGPWRWYDESMLDCCESLEKIKAEGITFGKVACLAQCAGTKVEALRTNQSTIDKFRDNVIKCTSSESSHLIASYNRKHFQQTGTGHFSPVGGYHTGRDMVLILDVARFKYPPHWVPLKLLWEAMDTVDETTGRPRGFILVSSLERAPSMLYTLSCRDESWINMAKYLTEDVPVLLKSEGLSSVPQALLLLFKSLPANVGEFIKWVAEVRRQDEDGFSLSIEEKRRLAMKEEVLQEVRKTKLFEVVEDLLSCVTSGSGNISSLKDEQSLMEIAATVCCQGAAIFSKGLTARTGLCFSSTCLKFLRDNGDKPMTVVSGTVSSGGNEHGIEILVPVSTATSKNCCSDSNDGFLIHPITSDVLTVLVFALPNSTWKHITDGSLLAEIQNLVSIENLSDVLKQEVFHLLRQFHYLQRCKDKEFDEDLMLPSDK